MTLLPIAKERNLHALLLKLITNSHMPAFLRVINVISLMSALKLVVFRDLPCFFQACEDVQHGLSLPFLLSCYANPT